MSSTQNIEKSNAYLRARIHALDALREKFAADLAQNPTNKELQLHLALIRNGVFPPHINESNEIEKVLDKNDNALLSFAELSSYGTFFAMHPGKVCGNEILTTSRDFPVKIDGTKTIAEATIQRFIDSGSTFKVKKPSKEQALILEAIQIENLLTQL